MGSRANRILVFPGAWVGPASNPTPSACAGAAVRRALLLALLMAFLGGVLMVLPAPALAGSIPSINASGGTATSEPTRLPTGAGGADPVISVSPSSLSASLLTGETIAQPLTVSNGGSVDLTYAVHIVSTALTTPSQFHRRECGSSPSPAPMPENVSGGPLLQPQGACYAFGVGPQRILLYADDDGAPGNQHIDKALQALGLAYTAYYYDATGFGSALASQPWDLVIIDQNGYYAVGSLWEELRAYLLGGGKLLISTFDIDGSNSEPTTLWATLGIASTIDVFSASPIHWWERSHPIFNVPESVPDFTQMQELYTDDGDEVSVGPPSRAVAGYTAISSPD